MTYKEHEIVTLAVDIPEEDLKKGQYGTIVHAYPKGGSYDQGTHIFEPEDDDAYELEVQVLVTKIITVYASQLKPPTSSGNHSNAT